MRAGSFEVTEVFKVNCSTLEKKAIQASNIISLKTKIDSIILNNSGPTSQITARTSIIETNVYMLFRDIIAVFSQKHVEHIKAICGQNKHDRA